MPRVAGRCTRARGVAATVFAVIGTDWRWGQRRGAGSLRVGDLLGTGMPPGHTQPGRQPLAVQACERRYLADGDTVSFTGAATGLGFKVGFGAVIGQVLPAR